MSGFEKKFLKRAIEIAKNNVVNATGGPFGAVIVKDGAIIAEGANKVTAINDPTAHAEIVAIREACRKLNTFVLSDCDIYSSCEPCPMCLGAIYWARLRTIYFASDKNDSAKGGFDDSFIYDEIKVPIEKRTIPTFHKPSANADKVFERWIKEDNKIKY